MPESVRFRCRGHRNLRATHHKTLELTREAEISSRATCVVGVSAGFDPRRVARLRGPLRLEMRVAERREVVHAVATPFMAATDSLVFRRSDQRRGKTFAFAADRSAGDLGRAFVEALGSPEAEIEVTLTEVPGETTGALLVLLEGPGPGLSPEARRYLEAADLLAARQPGLWRELAQGPEPSLEILSCRREKDLERLLSELETGRRIVLAVGMEDLSGGAPALKLLRHAARAGVPLTSIGCGPPWLRALALSGVSADPFHLRHSAGTAATWQRDLASPVLRESTLVLGVKAGEIRARLAAVAAGSRQAVLVARDPGGSGEALWWGRPDDLAEAVKPRRGEALPWFLVVGPEPEAETREPAWGDAGHEAAGASGPTVRLLAELANAEIPLKTLAHAVRGEFGGSHRRAYRTLLELRRKGEAE